MNNNLQYELSKMATELNHQQCFKEEYLSQEELIKIVSSLQQIYLKQQDLLSEALEKHQSARNTEKEILLASEQEIAKIKQEFISEFAKLKTEYASKTHAFKKELNKLREA